MSLGGGELNSGAKAISEGIGVLSASRELFGEDQGTTLGVDAGAGKGALLRTGPGQVEHLSAKQLWVQGAMQSHCAEVQKCLAARTPSTCWRIFWGSQNSEKASGGKNTTLRRRGWDIREE